MLASLGLVLGLTVANPAGAACEPGQALTPGPDALHVPIEERLALLEDEGRSLSFEDVSGPSACARFEAPPDPSQITTPGGGRYWLRIRIDLRGARTRHWLLFLPIANFERACAWLPLLSGQQAIRCIGLDEPKPGGALASQRNRATSPGPVRRRRPGLHSIDQPAADSTLEAWYR